MADSNNSEQARGLGVTGGERRTVFVTVGTYRFDELVSAVMKEEFQKVRRTFLSSLSSSCKPPSVCV